MKLNYVLEKLGLMPASAKLLFLTLSLLICAGCQQDADISQDKSPMANADYIGSQQCKDCHQNISTQWQGSQHYQAMLNADEQSVKGDFSNTHFKLHGQTSSFSKQDGKYYVETDAANGAQTRFPISATFGVYPLQQYLIDFPGGRKQALSIAWDTRNKKDGGQRWFHLYPDDPVKHDDVLHWSGPNQNWNYQCADCHSTNLRKNYDAKEQRFNTDFSEINVGCEACHGPASNHIEWTKTQSDDTKKGFKHDSKARDQQINSCAHCHSRRSQIADGFSPDKAFDDFYLPSLLRPGLYEADGQILEEVYVYGSFLQSKMHQKGVVCSDCHNTHSATLKVDDNTLCTQCHNATPPVRFSSLTAKNYDSEAHHFHTKNTQGSACRDCHMPAKTYMGVDKRFDHSFRIPRPDLSLTLGTPNTCTSCHQDKDARWAANVLKKRGVKVTPHYGETQHSVISGAADARRQLLATIGNKDIPAIQRATSLSMLGPYVDGESIALLNQSRYDASPLVRRASLLAASGLPPEQRWRFANGLLDDKSRSVRIEAGRLLAPALADIKDPDEHKRLKKAIDEYIAAQRFNAERPEAQTNLAILFAQLRDIPNAEKHYLAALDLSAQWVPAYINLADLYRGTGRDSLVFALIQKGIGQVPDNADLQHTLGLWYSRAKQAKKAADTLAKAANLAPENPRYSYVSAIASHSVGQTNAALTQLKDALSRFPNNQELLFAATTINRDAGNTDEALKSVKRLLLLQPNDSSLLNLQQQLSSKKQ